MTYAEVLKTIHLVAAATWTGGLITVGALVPALRRAGVSRDQLRAMARRFGAVSWTALAALIASGIAQVGELGVSWTDGTLDAKLTLVVLLVVAAGAHQLTASRSSPAVRGAVQGIILGLSIAIFGVAVTL